jgi:hypothetical protein
VLNCSRPAVFGLSLHSLASVRGPCFRFVLLHSGCGTFAFGLYFRLGSRSPTSVRGHCFRLVPSLLFRGGLSRDFVSCFFLLRAFVAWFVICLRCSACCVPSFPLVECLCSRLWPSFSASAFVLGFGLRSSSASALNSGIATILLILCLYWYYIPASMGRFCCSICTAPASSRGR